ncbi:MAG: TIM44-like domain-containing protein [Acetobacteraceae bacterium]|nr:TIM44-like domain-containing protein [Acetobacteraceae bacterium]
MRRRARFLATLAVLALALAPALAEARPGGGSSSGSRGSRSYSAPPATRTAPDAARPFDRTQTAPGPANPGYGAPAARPGTAAGQPARGGFMGGLLGAGLLGMLLGAGFFGGLSGIAGMLGFLLQIALIFGLVMLAFALFRRRQPQPAGMPAAMMRERVDGPPPGGGVAGGLARGPARPADEVGIGGTDYAQFEALLKQVNAAWSSRDIATLQRIATPEMAQYFRDDYAALEARGWRNETRDVVLESGDLAEAWREGAREYATVAMRFSLVDVTREVATGRVTEGHPDQRQTATELWTFVRVQGGPWQLSAIQQVGR